jgi:anti-sigma regulatory factor (Ser/Thr protein kinase)
VRSALGNWGGTHRLIEDAELVVSEFATNAFLHARSPFTVALHGRINGVRIEVSDAAQIAHPRICTVPHPLDTSGRGLRLVADVASDWGFELTSAGKTVWAELVE